MPIFSNGGVHVFFSHIPKTGGSAIEALVRRSPVLMSLFSTRLHGGRNQSFPVSPQHFHTAIVERLFAPGFFALKLAVVRHPVHRLKSEFRMRYALEIKARKTPPEFNGWLGMALETRAKDPFHLDNHLRPQIEFIDDETDVVRFEDGLGVAVQRIFQELNLAAPAEAPRRNDFPRVEITLAKTALDRIVDTYAADFERFNYSIGEADDYSEVAPAASRGPSCR